MFFSRSFSQYFAILSIALAILISGCSSDDTETVVLDPDVTSITAPYNLMAHEKVRVKWPKVLP